MTGESASIDHSATCSLTASEVITGLNHGGPFTMGEFRDPLAQRAELALKNSLFLPQIKLVIPLKSGNYPLLMDDPRKKLISLFEFLKDFNAIRNPVVRTVSDQKFSIRLADAPKYPSIQLWSKSEESLPILRVVRPHTSRGPDVPENLKDWISYDPTTLTSPKLQSSRNVRQQDGSSKTVGLDDDPKRRITFDTWYAEWKAWAEAEEPARAALRFFNSIYALYGELQRESEAYELILGEGLLTLPSLGINHPVILQRLQLQFNSDVPEFVFVEADSPTELYTSLLYLIPEVAGAQLSKATAELKSSGLSPNDVGEIEGFLRGLIHSIHRQGQFLDSTSDSAAAEVPTIRLDRHLIVRSRLGGTAKAIGEILAELNRDVAEADVTTLPTSLLNICGIETAEKVTPREPSIENHHYGNEVEDVLLTKPANDAQVRIVERLEAHGSVLVQGPPGTGKTHTIGNLIGHLLAQGKRVLITAQTTKALSVVRNQVVEPLRPLCVSVLENDMESRGELEKAVSSISERLANDDSTYLHRQAAKLKKQRTEYIETLKKLRRNLLEARQDEYRDVLVGGAAVRPVEAAKFVADGVTEHAWVPSNLKLGAELPLSEEEIVWLYGSHAMLTPADEAEIDRVSPPIAELRSPAEFAQFVADAKTLDEQRVSDGQQHWTLEVDESNEESLQQIQNGFATAVSLIPDSPAWCIHTVSASMESDAAAIVWRQMISIISEAKELNDEFQPDRFNFDPKLEKDSQSFETLSAISGAICKHLEAGGKLGFVNLMTKPSWRKFIDASTVNGRKPSSLDEFRALDRMIRLEHQREVLCRSWQRLLEPLGAHSVADLGTEPERICSQYIEHFEARLIWHSSYWTPMVDGVQKLGFDWSGFFRSTPPMFGEHGDLMRLRAAASTYLPPILNGRIIETKRRRVQRIKLELLSAVEATAKSDNASNAAKSLYDAIVEQDAASYETSYLRLGELEHKRQTLSQRRSLLSKMRFVAPGWAQALEARSGRHGDETCPGSIQHGWLWRQWHDELEKRAGTAISSIERDIQRLTDQLRDVTTQLAETQAWAFQIERVGTSERQALMGWLQTIRRIGAGTGKKVPALRRQAQEQMARAKEAVPVWIMPISRVLENFSPTTTTFDVIVIDEASQANLLGLIPLYMAKHVVVVGDHEQVSPDAVGEEVEELQKLIELHLKDIPNRHLYDGRLSIYDLAQTSFSGAIMLVEHFRCDPDIIEFSNNLSYEGRIKPLRDTSGVVTKPAVVPYRVRNGYSEKKVNEAEIVTVSSLLAACLTFPEYQLKQDGSPVTYGIISMLGLEQAQRIRAFLLEKLDPRVLEQHRLLAGNPAQFQGDERDIVFISLVDSNRDGHVLPLRQSDMYKKRYNVAASRARDQMWIVHSLNHATDLKAADLRRRLIEHANDPSSINVKIEAAEKKADSIFERRVLESLIRKGYKVTPQWPVGKFRIDLVVEGKHRRLAVELDGEKFHPPEKLTEDMERQAMLERAGWQFVRIRGSLYFRNPDRALKPLFDTLTELGIQPEGQDVFVDKPAVGQVQEILRTAERIRRDWGFEEEVPEEECVSVVPELKDTDTVEIDLPLTIHGIAKATGRNLNEVTAEAWKHLRYDGEPDAAISKRETPDFLKLFDLYLSE